MSEPFIRAEQVADKNGVRAVNERAFGGRAEADIVEALHRAQAAVVALVAEVGAEVVGHILFSPVDVEQANGKRLVGLAPMAVAPDYQRQGIGSQLVREGLARCRANGFDGVVVLGHAEYYPRFGFVLAPPQLKRNPLGCRSEAGRPGALCWSRESDRSPDPRLSLLLLLARRAAGARTRAARRG